MLTLSCYQVKSLEVRSLDVEFLKNSSHNSPIHSFVSEFILFSSVRTSEEDKQYSFFQRAVSKRGGGLAPDPLRRELRPSRLLLSYYCQSASIAAYYYVPSYTRTIPGNPQSNHMCYMLLLTSSY